MAIKGSGVGDDVNQSRDVRAKLSGIPHNLASRFAGRWMNVFIASRDSQTHRVLLRVVFRNLRRVKTSIQLTILTLLAACYHRYPDDNRVDDVGMEARANGRIAPASGENGDAKGDLEAIPVLPLPAAIEPRQVAVLEVRGTSNVLPALSDAGQPAASRPAGKDASSQTKILPTQVDAPQILPVAPQLDTPQILPVAPQLDAPQNQQEPEFIPIDPEPVLDQGGAAPQDKHAGDQNPKVKESGAAPDMVEKTQHGQRADESDLPPPLPSPLPPLSPPPSPPPPLPSLPESGQPMIPRPIIGQPSGTPLVVTPPVPIVEQPLFAVAAMPEKESEDPADKPENKGGDLTQFKLEPEAQKDRVMTETEAQQDTQYHPVGAGDWSNDGRSLALVGSSSLDPESRVSPNGSIIYLSTGGSTAHPQIVTLGAGVDNVIYRIGIGSTRNGWEPFDGVQEIRNFKIGTDKLWFARTERNPEWQHDLKGLETRYQDAKITYSILDYGGAAGFIPGSVLGVKISGAFIGGMPIVAHQLELRFDNLDDQRRSFDILAKQQNSFEQGRLSVFAEIMGDSLNFINQWSDLGLGSDLPDLSQLPEIV